MSVRLYVEGGGRSALKGDCRAGFKNYLKKAGIPERSFKVIACGSRNSAFKMFCTALRQYGVSPYILLLVDSEGPVSNGLWHHVAMRPGDNWQKPPSATEDNLHFMIQCMEAWFISDPSRLSSYYGKGFRVASLPKNRQIEQIQKVDILRGLEAATRDTAKGTYNKGSHSFDILALIDPNNVAMASQFAKRLIATISRHI